MNKIKLICLPFAGGSKFSYYRYRKFAPQWLDIIPIDLPGRGSRITEKLLTDMHAIVDDVLEQVRPHISSTYAIYGHSMGGLTALLLIRRLRAEGLELPVHLFVTGHGGPSFRKPKVVRHSLPKKELVDELNLLDGMPEDIMQNESMIDYFLPVIRADFKAFETYDYETDGQLDMPITCVIGKEENITLEGARAWEQETTAPVDVRQFPGRHFFIYQHDGEVVRLISRKLSAVVANQLSPFNSLP